MANIDCIAARDWTAFSFHRPGCGTSGGTPTPNGDTENSLLPGVSNVAEFSLDITDFLPLLFPLNPSTTPFDRERTKRARGNVACVRVGLLKSKYLRFL